MTPDLTLREFNEGMADLRRAFTPKGTPMPPARFEDVEARREGRHKRRAAIRNRRREVERQAHLTRIRRMRKAREARR